MVEYVQKVYTIKSCKMLHTWGLFPLYLRPVPMVLLKGLWEGEVESGNQTLPPVNAVIYKLSTEEWVSYWWHQFISAYLWHKPWTYLNMLASIPGTKEYLFNLDKVPWKLPAHIWSLCIHSGIASRLMSNVYKLK